MSELTPHGPSRSPRDTPPPVTVDPPGNGATGGRVRSATGWAVVAGILSLLVVIVLAWATNTLSWPRNPFGQREVDRSQPVLLESVRDLSRYVAASGNFQVVIDLEKDAKFIPSAVLGERTLFVGAGSVDAYVEFSGLSRDAITVSSDKKSVDIRLPAPTLGKPSLDHSRSYVFARQRGVLDKVGALFKDNPNSAQELYVLAERKIGAAAQQAGLAARAEQNTRQMLQGMLRSLGYAQATVAFTPTG